jgi:signal transduction histidine kinase
MKNWFNNLKVKTKLLLSFFLMLIVIIASIGVSYYNSNRLINDAQWVAHTHQVIAKSEGLLSTTIDAETGQRGYLLTGLERYLEPFNKAMKLLPERLNEIKSLTSDNSNQQKRLLNLEKLIEQKTAELNQTISLKRNGKEDDALQVVRSDKGKILQDKIRIVIENMVSEENILLSKRMKSTEDGQKIMFFTLLFFLGFSLLIVIVLSIIISNSITKPIAILSNAVIQVSEGNYQSFISIDKTKNDEISTISKSFNHMIKTLRDTFENINLKSIELDKKNKELDQFSYIVAHDLKEPLRNISSLVGFLKEDAEDKLDGDDLENMNLIVSRAERMDRLISDVLSYSKLGKESIVKTTENITLILEEVIGDLQIVESKFNIELKGDFPVMNVERVFLRQVFSNIISNAIKYNENENGELVISYRQEGPFNIFSFQDNGPGIIPQYHEKLFKIFQTLHGEKREDSTGIGLATVKKIIEEMGGEITLDSDEGKGCNFEVKLPNMV